MPAVKGGTVTIVTHGSSFVATSSRPVKNLMPTAAPGMNDLALDLNDVPVSGSTSVVSVVVTESQQPLPPPLPSSPPNVVFKVILVPAVGAFTVIQNAAPAARRQRPVGSDHTVDGLCVIRQRA